jgi:hypothetical protein
MLVPLMEHATSCTVAVLSQYSGSSLDYKMIEGPSMGHGWQDQALACNDNEKAYIRCNLSLEVSSDPLISHYKSIHFLKCWEKR